MSHIHKIIENELKRQAKSEIIDLSKNGWSFENIETVMLKKYGGKIKESYIEEIIIDLIASPGPCAKLDPDTEKYDELDFDDDYSGNGPALFVDPQTGKIRALKGVPDEPGRISEHEAVNAACNELVFKRRKEPLAKGDPLYDYVSRIDFTVDIYVIDDNAFKEELLRNGYPYLAEGLITHAGTWRDPETNRHRAHNIFIPGFIYKFLLGLLEKESEIPDAALLLEFWRLHEITHFWTREIDSDKGMSEGTKDMARLIFVLSKAERELEQGMLEEALECTKEAIELDSEFAVTLELRGRINEAKENWSAAYQDYLVTLVEINSQREMITIGHPLEDRILDMIERAAKSEGTSISKIIMILLSFFGDLDRKNLEPDDYGQALLVSYFGILPVVFKYLTRSLKKDIVLA
ncbi:MAG: hypothetical protein KAU58_06135, partial [Candidatus Omnitrophica bacterium]|nr:hypothetical protein [Candidatus Omnitrophota bacterium]